jgi:hypothetical protein
MVPCTEVLCELGATNEDVARALQVHVDTVYDWMQKHPDFSEATKGKEIADEHVVRSLYQRATGYQAPDGAHIPAHPTAMIFWLKNRQSAKWRDKTEVQTQIDPMPADPEVIVQRLVTMATQYPTLNPVIRKLAKDILMRVPELT